MRKEPEFKINQNNLGFFNCSEEPCSNVVVSNSRNLAALNRVIEWMAHNSSKSLERFPKVATLENYLSEQYYLTCLRSSVTADEKFVLTTMQEQALWQKIVKKNMSLDWSSTVQIAHELRVAWKTQSYWRLDSGQLGKMGSNASKVYLELLKKYRSNLIKLGALDQVLLMLSSLSEQCVDKVTAHGLFSPAPVIQSWLKRNSRDALATRVGTPAVHHHKFSSKIRELELSLNWARRTAGANPSAKVAVVVDSNPSDTVVVRSVCEDVFDGTFYYSHQDSLAEKPFVKLAFLILEIKDVPRWDLLSNLINHPLLHGADSEGSERALFDLDLRGRGRYEWPLKWVIEVLESTKKCPILKAILVEILHSNKSIGRKRSVQEWLSFFKKRWKSVHWLDGDSKLLIASELLDDFASVLDQVAELNAVLGSVSYAEVVWYLKNAFNAKKVRNLQGPTNIYVVNAEEAVTVDPTHLWITECTVKKPSLQVEIVAMLPFAEQRMVGIPGSHPSVDFTYRRILFESLCRNRKEINLSYSEMDKGVEILPSAFAPGLQHASLRGENFFDRECTSKRIQFSSSIDDFGPKMPKESVLKGGASVLEAQAACPFKGFARYRLNSIAPEEVTPGVSRKARGIVTHKALATIWNGLKKHSSLMVKRESELSLVVQMAVNKNLEQFRDPTKMEIACGAVEEQLLNKLLISWLKFEKNAQPFVAFMLEKEIKVEINDLKLVCRVDRVDVLDDGTKRIVDYKTGECSLSVLNPPRPDSAQLLLYAVYSSVEDVSSVAFGKVDNFNSKFLSRDIFDFGVKYPEWQTSLEALANELQDGFALVSPKRNQTTCKNCEQQLLCRIKTKDVNWDDAN